MTDYLLSFVLSSKMWCGRVVCEKTNTNAMFVALLLSFQPHDENSGRHLQSKESNSRIHPKKTLLGKVRKKNTMNMNSYRDIWTFETWRSLKGK